MAARTILINDDSYTGSFTVWAGATLNSVKRYNLSDQLGHLQKQTVQVRVDRKYNACALLLRWC